MHMNELMYFNMYEELLEMLIIYLSNKGGKVGVCEPFGNLIIKQVIKGGIDNNNCMFNEEYK